MRHQLVPFFSSHRHMNPWSKSIDDVMDRFLTPYGKEQGAQGFTPAVDVVEESDKFLFTFDLPGVAKEDVKIEIHDNELLVSGERKSETKSDEKNAHIVERFYGQFSRTFSLPQTVDSAKVQAQYKDGVLTVTVPKAEETKARQIKIS